MSINTAHANNGVLIHAGEAILLFSDNVSMEFSGQDDQVFKGTKNGSIYLTTHRMIFNAKNMNDQLKSFSSPFICMTDVEVEQPIFGANHIKGKVRAQENGNFIGEVKFKLVFKSGGAIDFAQAMLRAAHMAKQNAHGPPPPYTPPSGAWFEAPPPAYAPNPAGYYGWLPQTNAFPNNPAPNTVFMSDNPPPYPGIVPPQSQAQQPPPSYPGYWNQNPGYPQPNQGYPQPNQGYPQPNQGYPQPNQGYPQPNQGYPQPNQGYPQPNSEQQNNIYPQVPPTSGNQQPAYNPSYSQQNYQQSYNPHNPHNASGYAPPPNM